MSLQCPTTGDGVHNLKYVLQALGAVVHLVQVLEMVDVIHDHGHALRANGLQHVAVYFRRSHDGEQMRLNDYGDGFGLGLGSHALEGLDEQSAGLGREIVPRRRVRTDWVAAARAD